jgi:mannobiose 2-epimerase
MTSAVAAAPAKGVARSPQDWSLRVRAELVGNILPFWPRHAIDRAGGGFFGEIADDLTIRPHAVRASVVNTRILWTFAAAARVIGPEWRETADWAFEAVTDRFWDNQSGGLFWWLDWQSKPLALRKQTYAQAFGIYALSEYYRLTGNPTALDYAKRLYELIEEHCFDPRRGGYIEALDRDWKALADMRLSDKDLNSPKSMNTHLHILEGYTNLLRVWPDEGLRQRQKALIEIMLDRIVDSTTGHFKLFFDEAWTSLIDHVSFGHDIEGSWLFVEAAEVVGDAALIARTQALALRMAGACLGQGVDIDGSMFFEADGQGNIRDADKHWWVQAEAVVGFYNAYQLSGDVRFRDAARRVWDYIENHVVDREHGEWHAKLTRDGTPVRGFEDADAVLVGPWKCPYHNARVCFEMLNRLGNEKETP